jgi:hypothetical protein
MDAVFVISLLIVVVVIYLLPTIVARHNHHPKGDGSAILNIFLGWTLIGWVVALVWAASGPSQRQEEIAENQLPCPYCGEPILEAATVCRFCTRDLPAGWAKASRAA